MQYYFNPTLKMKPMEQTSLNLLQNSLKEKKFTKLSQLLNKDKGEKNINTS